MATYDLTSSIPTKIAAGDILNCPYSGTYKTITLPKGTYKFECWGAQGGGNYGGKGGYVKGTFSTESDVTAYLYSGQSGSLGSPASSTYNGGGASGTYSGYTQGSGGGASDIRINSTSLYARIIVAGGGGGAGSNHGSGGKDYGGEGGGTNGIKGHSDTSTSTSTHAGTQATQTTGYSFGTGGNADSSTTGGGGGGGWYGGGGTKWEGGSGGSGYVYTSSTASNYPSGCLLNSSMYLTDTVNTAGNASMPSVSGSTETGHSGNGYVRVTVISVKSEYDDLPGYDITSGMPNKLKTGDILKCRYTGNAISIQLPKGTYKLECWGAQGGGVTNTSYWSGGKGGYAVGTLTLTSEKTIYCFTGGKPTTYRTAGFNGGGGCPSGSSYSNPGGGASDIRIGQNSLYARVIVAGGGGGASNGSSSYTATGGVGGGTTGGAGVSNNYSAGVLGQGGTQTAGGAYGYWSGYSSGGVAGSFGQGGSPTAANYEAGGGGGWYGGGSGNYCSAGGGSGYVYTSSTASNYPSGCLLDSSMYLTDAQTIAGNTSMPSVPGSTETGHSGNGFIRITVISAGFPFRMKQNGEWKEASSGFVKVSGEWKEISKVLHKANGEWIED